MLKSIARLSPDLLDFINSFDHRLNQPQAHVSAAALAAGKRREQNHRQIRTNG